MKFNTVANAFNHYRTMSVEELEARAQEINDLIDNDANADVEALNIELRGIKEAKENIDLRSAKTFNKISGIELGNNASKTDDLASTAEYRSAFFKKLLGRELTSVETKVFSGLPDHRTRQAIRYRIFTFHYFPNPSKKSGLPISIINKPLFSKVVNRIPPYCRYF